MTYTTIITEGGLLPADILDAIAAEELTGQRPEDFGLERGRNLSDRIAAAWQAARGHWMLFKTYVEDLREGEPGTSVTRQRWVLPLLDVLGYQLAFNQGAYQIEGRSYAISHRAGQHDDAPPIHVEGIRTSLDARPPSGRPRLSPHALLQEYLNSTEHLWGIVTNGERLRLLRDSSRFTRPTYVEFDLRAMFEGEKFSEFALLYRLIHRSRLPHDSTDTSSCLLEKYHQQAVESGGRVREKLRDGVETALRTLGNGLLEHPANAELRAKVESGRLTPLAYYRQLLKLVYRLLFLMVAEERGLIATGTRRLTTTEDDPFEITSVQSFDALLSSLVRGPSVSDRLRIYYDNYSVARLRRLAEQPGTGRGPYDDLWMGLQTTFQLLEGSDEQSPRSLGLAPLDGDLFGHEAIADLEGQRLRNADLLHAIRALSLYREKDSKALRRVNYGALDVEELGSVYESLLDYRPVVAVREYATNTRIEDSAHSSIRGQFVDGISFDLVAGTERKTTGSYYTRPELVQELIKSALVPVIEDRLKGAMDKEKALLAITVCDPACGSGHFLLAAARRIGRELAKVRSGEEQPTPAQFRRAVRDVIQHCIYGVDLNPLAVDLCKLALWIEGHNAGMPLSFLDHHIKQGNSLIGATRALVAQGIPDDAYKAVTGDDKTTASSIKKRNKAERERYLSGYDQRSLFEAHTDDGGAALADALRQLDDMSSGSVAEVRAKAARYRQVRAEAEAEFTHFNLWTAAFFQPLTPENAPRIPTTATLADYERNPRTVRADLLGAANGLAMEAGFFHWELEFPQVFEGEPSTNDSRIHEYAGGAPFVHSSRIRGRHGFDVVLGNPPWERIKLQEQEHWVDVPEVRDAPNKAAREKVIQAWRASADPARQTRIALFDAAKYRAEAESRFVRSSERFPLTAVGDVNTYALFAEHARDLLAPTGRAGIIVPTGIATSDTTKRFFESVVSMNSLVSLYDFLEARDFFVGLESRDPFCLLTVQQGSRKNDTPSEFIFKMLKIDEMRQELRRVQMFPADFELLNPNTHTCPIFRTRIDAELTKRLYQHAPVLINENSGENHWGMRFMTMFHMSNDSHLFRDAPNEARLPLYEAKLLHQFSHRWATYEGVSEEDVRKGFGRGLTPVELANPNHTISTRYWVERKEVEARLAERNWPFGWLLGFRDIARSTDERTAIFGMLPRVAVGNKIPLIFPSSKSAALAACFLACVDSLPFDFVVRQKVGGTTLNFFIVYQLPVLPPSAFSEADIAFIVPRVLELVYTAWDMQPFAEDVWNESGQESGASSQDAASGAGGIDIHDVRAKHSPSSMDAGRRLRANASPPQDTSMPRDAGGDIDDTGVADLPGLPAAPERHGQNPAGLATIRDEILRRNAECDVGAPPDLFAPRDGFPLPPFRWNDERRALIRAELDARIARLYGLTRDELRYILDPADVYGPDFPGETFRVLKEKETKQFGEYRTRRLVLEAWDREEADTYDIGFKDRVSVS